MGSNYLKQIHFELKGKKTNENLSFTIKNSQKKGDLLDVQRAFKLVHSYPFSDDFKVKVI